MLNVKLNFVILDLLQNNKIAVWQAHILKISIKTIY